MTADDWLYAALHAVVYLGMLFALFKVGQYIRAVFTGPARDREARLEMTNLRTEEESNMGTFKMVFEVTFDESSLKDAVDGAAAILEEVENQSGEVTSAKLIAEGGAEIPLE